MKDNANNLYSYLRNALGQVTQIQSSSVRYNYAYDAAHRRIQTIDSRAGKTLSYTYSPGGLLNRMQDSDSNRTDYLYDAAGRLTGIWTPNYDYVSFGYDAGGRLAEKWFTNGVDARYGYNADNTLASLVNKDGSTTISNHVYTYDALGNRQTQAETVNGTTLNYTYGYDQLNRLIQVQNGTSAQQQNYTFDPIGNRLTKTIGSTTTAYVHDAANQLKEIRSGTPTGTLLATLTYDANGNLKTRSDTSQTFIYDALNRLKQVTQTSQPTQSYSYDDEGRRISKTVGTTTTNFLYSGPNLIAEYASTWGTPTAQYAYGPMIDNVIEKITSTSAQYFHQDGLNSVMAATNNLGTTDATQRFDAWGNKIASTGTSPRNGYTGREPDETGLIYYRARYYDPGLGRFTQRDPIGLAGSLSQYGYGNGSPSNYIDPLGLSGTLTIYSSGANDGSRGSGGLSGHSWISYAPDGGTPSTYGTWGNDPLGLGNGLHENLEQGREADASRSEHLSDAQEAALMKTIDKYVLEGTDAWGYLSPCSSFASDAWNKSTGENLNPYGPYSNPSSLKNSIEEKNKADAAKKQESEGDKKLDPTSSGHGGGGALGNIFH